MYCLYIDDLTLSSADRYVVNDLEKTLTDDGTVPTTKPVPKSKQALHKSRSKSLHFSNKKSPTEPLEVNPITAFLCNFVNLILDNGYLI